MNERFMRTNERTMQPSDLVVISTETFKDRKIEVFPDFFVYDSRTRAELTNAGRIYLRALCDDYMNEKVTVEELLCNLDTISKEFPCDSDLVYDKMFFELTKMMES